MESLYDSYYLRGANPFGFVLSNTLYDNNVRIPATISCLNHNINIPELFEGCNIKFEEQDYPLHITIIMSYHISIANQWLSNDIAKSYYFDDDKIIIQLCILFF